MADAAICKLGTIMHATAQADTAIPGCSGYCTLKAITGWLLLLTNSRLVL